LIGERAAVFASALEQSEQLMRAAEVVGPAAQPLPLFYALSQAGRAIAAVHLPDAGWRLAGHGLSAPLQLQDGVSDLVRRAIEPREESKKAVAAGRRSSFAGVTDAIGSEQLSGVVELGAVWAAMPDLIAPVPQMPSLHPAWRRPLRAYSALWNENDVRTAKLTTGRPLELLIAGLPVDPDPDVAFDADAMVEELSAYYPTSAGVAISVWRGGHHPALLRQWAPTGESLPVFCWPDVRCPLRPEQMDAIAPDHRDRGIRLLLPRPAWISSRR
jgi:hypothetical protein